MRTAALILVMAASSGCALFGVGRQPAPMPEPAPMPSAQSADATSAAEPAPDLATVLLSSPKATDPEPYKGIGPGASRADVAAAIPGLEGDVVAKDVQSRTRATIRWSREDETVESLYMLIGHPDAKALAEEHWGPATEIEATSGPQYVWFDPETKRRAVMKPEREGVSMQIEPYEPVATFLGAGEAIGFEQAQPLIGMTLDELRAAYPDQVEGDDEASVHLDFAPTDHGEHFTRVNVRFDNKGQIESYYFPLAFRRKPAAMEEYRTMLVDKWGEPKKGKRLSRVVDVYRAKGPRIEARHDDISDAWEIRVSKK